MLIKSTGSIQSGLVGLPECLQFVQKSRSKINPGDAKAIYLPPSPDMPTPPVGTHFFVSGWGRLSKTGSGCYPNTLNAVSLPSISLKGCKEAYAPDNWPVTEDMICTSYPGGGRDTCSGDSGGMKIVSLLRLQCCERQMNLCMSRESLLWRLCLNDLKLFLCHHMTKI